MERPVVSPGTWIRIGARSNSGRSAVTCNVRDDAVEVVYLNDKSEAINEDVRWSGESWEFASFGAVGGYADRYDRLRDYVAILRRGRG